MDGMRLRLIGEIEELGHGARIELIAPLGPRRGESMGRTSPRAHAPSRYQHPQFRPTAVFPDYLPFPETCYTGVQPRAYAPRLNSSLLRFESASRRDVRLGCGARAEPRGHGGGREAGAPGASWACLDVLPT